MAKISPVVDSLDGVPEALRQFYEQVDGKFVLSLNGTPHGFVTVAEHDAQKAKVVEFRDTNIALTKEIEPLRAIKKTLGTVDPTDAVKAVTRVKELETQGVTKPDDLAAAIKKAVEDATAPLKTTITNLETKNVETEKKAQSAVLRSSIGEVFAKAGGIPEALDFVIGKSDGTFVVENGTVRAAQNKFSTAKPGDPLSIDEWIGDLAKNPATAFAFKPSTGGGGGGGDKKISTNPNQQVLRDPTPQQLGNPATAKGIREGNIRVEYTGQQ